MAKPFERFEPHRYTCKSCRSEQARDSKRRARADEGQATESPFPGVTSAPSPDAGHEPFVRILVVEEKLQAGRVESDANGQVRLKLGAVDNKLVEALRQLDPLQPL